MRPRSIFRNRTQFSARSGLFARIFKFFDFLNLLGVVFQMRHRRFVLGLLLIALTAASFHYSFRVWREDKGEIMMQLSDIFAELALPYRLAKLELAPRDESLLLPVRATTLRSVADTWGAARSAGRTHEGTDIFAPRGTEVYSATDGYVVRTGVNSLGGNFVMVAGAGGYRYYYAHLDSIAAGVARGMKVTPDTVLGFVGNTGNASNTPPHLHFGMYKRGAENPFPFLVDR